MLDISGPEVQQADLPLEEVSTRDQSRLMSAIDSINARFGKGTVHVGSAGNTGDSKSWQMRQERRTPRYTTEIADIPMARA